jgi:2-keto-4-pentenoate hydratase
MRTKLSGEGVAEAARLLMHARAGGLLPRLPPHAAPPDLDSGYAIQARVQTERGAPIHGYKIGMTDPAARRAAGLDAPILGRLARNDVRWAPAKIAVGDHHIRIVEAEVIFEIGADLAPGKTPVTAADVAAATSALYAGIEVCNSRFMEDDVDWPSVVADNSNADLLIVGERLDEDALDALLQGRELPVSLALGGMREEGSTARVCGNPLDAVAWLANALAARGESLRAGQLVASGACTGLTEAGYDEPVVATFGAQASARMEFTRERAR